MMAFPSTGKKVCILGESKPRVYWNWSSESARAAINLETWTTVSTSSSSLGCVRNHEGAMSSRALAEGWSWAPGLTSNASSTLLGLSCLLTEYTSQKRYCLAGAWQGPKKKDSWSRPWWFQSDFTYKSVEEVWFQDAGRTSPTPTQGNVA